jgi:O-antigen ligase
VALLAPYFGLRMPGTSFTLIDLLLVLALFGAAIFDAKARLHDPRALVARYTPMVMLGLLFVLLGLLSGVEGLLIENYVFSLGSLLGSVGQYAFILIGLPIISARLLAAERVWGFLRLIALSYTVPMVITPVSMHPYMPNIFRDYFFNAGRAVGTFGNANTYAIVLVTLMPIYAVLSVSERGKWAYIGLTGLLLVFLNLFMTASYGGFLVLLLVFIANSLLFLVWRRHPFRVHWRRTVAIVMVLVMAAAVAGFVKFNSPGAKGRMWKRFDSLVGLARSERMEVREFGSAGIRIQMIEESVDMIIARYGGIWGHGLGQSKPISVYSQNVHLLYLLLWIEGGIILLLLYLFIMGVLLRNAFKLAVVQPAAAAALSLGVFTMIFAGLITTHLYLRFYWIPLLPAFAYWRSGRNRP